MQNHPREKYQKGKNKQKIKKTQKYCLCYSLLKLGV